MIPSPTALADQLRRAGITVPTAAQHALDAITAVRAAARRDPADDARAALDTTDLTPANVEQIFRNLTLNYARADHRDRAQAAIESPLAARFNAAIRDAADKLHTAARKAWKEPAGRVQQAGAMFGPNAGADDILRMGDQAAAAWRSLQTDLDQLDVLRTVIVMLGELTGRGEQHVSWFTTGITTREDLEAANLLFTGPGRVFHALAAGGFTLDLPTATEADGMVTTAATTSDRNAAARREAQLAQHRESWAPVLGALTTQR